MRSRFAFAAALLSCLLLMSGCNSDPTPSTAETDGGSIPVVREPPPARSLSVKLNVGDHFPLLKTVTQKLVAESPNGPQESHSELQMWLGLSVDKEAKDGSRYISVRYDRVVYSHDIAGQKLSYDSRTSSSRNLPTEIGVHAGVVNNGFGFWLTKENQVGEVVGFEEFLTRCVRWLPREHQGTTLAALKRNAGRDGVISFIDESIGLLPFRKGGVFAGETWSRSRNVTAPIPMKVTRDYRLARLGRDEVEIVVSGEILPEADQQGIGRLLSGQIVGHCKVDPETGIPQDSSIQRILQMAVRLPDGSDQHQKKVITTAIQTFLPDRSQPPIRIGSGRSIPVREASHTSN